jgi:hypothetical protein
MPKQSQRCATVDSTTWLVRYVGAVGVAVSVVLVSGCGGTDTPEVAEESAAVPNSSTSGSAVAPPSVTSTPATVPSRVRPAAEELLLTDAELIGSGWIPDEDTDPEAAEVQASSQPECSNQSWTLKTPEVVDDAASAWHFDSAAEVELITSQAWSYSSADAASAALAAYRDVASRCVSWDTADTGSGYAYHEQQELFDIPVAEEALGRHGTTSSIKYPEIGSFPMYWVAARNGSQVVQVTYRPGSLLSAPEGRARVETLAATAASKTQD